MSHARRISFVITGLDIGGAEMMLTRLLSRLDRSRFEPSVTSLTGIGEAGARIKALGIPCQAMGWRRGVVPGPLKLLRLARRLKAERPDIVHTWMYHADLVGGIAAKLSGIPTIWCIRHGALDGGVKRSTRWVARLNAWLSRLVPERVVVCSRAAERYHEALGYDAKRFTYIPNGIDISRFKPQPGNREVFRRALGVAEDAELVGHVARFDPQKDHATFLRSLERVLAARQDVHIVMCGRGVDESNEALAKLVVDVGTGRGRIHMLGERKDMEDVLGALDLLVSSSSSEAFPNVIAEAMACGVRCVATDVGESAPIVGDTGYVVPPGDPAALGRAILEALASDTPELRDAARAHIVHHYDIAAIARQYEALYDAMPGGNGAFV